MNMIQLEYFMTLAEELNFSRTAKKLYVTQPNISIQISALEKEWGVQLFYRRYRSVSLTPAGEIIYKGLKEASSVFDASIAKARSITKKETTPIVIGIPENSNLGNMPEILAEYQKSHPEYRITIESSPEEQLILPAISNRYDIVLNQLFLLENVQKLDVRLFSKIHFSIVISKEHPLVKGASSIDFSVFSESSINAYIPPSKNPSRLIEHCRYICQCCGFIPEEVIITPNVNSTLIAANMGLGIAILDEMVVNPPNLNLVFLSTPIITDMVLAWRRDNDKTCLSEIADLVSDNIKYD